MTETLRTFPGARAPARSYKIDAEGVGIAVNEWGNPDDPTIMLVHGGADFSRTYDGFAPRLAERGWRIVAWDQRGHGDSDRAQLYSWDADIRDAAHVFDAVSPNRPVRVLGHSKGGAMMISLADAQPFRFLALANIDGMPWTRPAPDIAEHERAGYLVNEIDAWLAHRRRTADASRKPDTIEGLARRRGVWNPRFSQEWLEYLVTVGADCDDDGWRWKLDPTIRLAGFGPWRPEWALNRLAGLTVPFLGLLVEIEEEMGWGSRPEHIEPWLPELGSVMLLDNVGHFPHIEDPDRIVEIVDPFFAAVQEGRK